MKTLLEKIDRFHLLDIKNETHPSVFTQTKEYDLFILTLPHREKELKIESFSFIFEKNSYFYFNRKNGDFEPLESLEDAYNIINNETNKTMKLATSIHSSIDWMEEQLYAKSQFKAFMHYWLTYKKELSRIQRLLTLAIEVMGLFIEHYKKTDGFLEVHFQDVNEHLNRTYRSVLLANDKLTNLYQFHTNRNNEKMNKTIYLLTILSGIFMPLNLLVGYFGMNTQGLPFDGLSNATTIVTFLMGGCAVVMAWLIYRFRDFR